MPFSLRIDCHDAARASAALGTLCDEATADMVGLVERTQARTVEALRGSAPVFTGELVNKIHGSEVSAERTGGVVRVSSVVQCTAPYVQVVEEGRRAGAPMPPEQPIQRWVELKLQRGDLGGGAGGKVVDYGRRGAVGSPKRDAFDRRVASLTWMIRAAIKRRGIPGKFIFRAAAARAEAWLVEGMTALREKWTAR